MVSIITATYNSQNTIERTIQSVLAQSIGGIEHIIVDGASSDCTLSVIEKYRADYEKREIKLRVISEADKGPYDAMNKGILLAQGEIIGILNSDDSYTEKTVETVKTVFENQCPDIFMGAVRIHNGSHIIIKRAKNRKYRTSRDFNHPAMFASKACYESVGVYATDNIHSDYGWFLKAIRMGKKFIVTNDILADFYVGGLSSAQNISDMFKRIRQKEAIYRDNGYNTLYYFECIIHEVMKYILLRR